MDQSLGSKSKNRGRKRLRNRRHRQWTILKFMIKIYGFWWLRKNESYLGPKSRAGFKENPQLCPKARPTTAMLMPTKIGMMPPAISFLESVTAKIEITKTKVPTIWSRLKFFFNFVRRVRVSESYGKSSLDLWRATYKQIPFEMCSPAG